MTEILKSHFLNLYAMALSDTQIDTVELETLYKIGEEKGIEKSEIDEIILKPDQVKFAFPNSLDEKIIYLYDFAKIILADGVVDKNERNTLELFCTRFGFEEDNISKIADFLIASAKENLDVNSLLQIINENLN
ncbi:MAG: hypothetical protein IM550_06830 [Microcystis sp. M54BS1]|nr:hypothetical protein [Microcystis sp. M54BS1]MCA6440985.1 hypothetical protein [Chitinophagaceae bacterium]MCA6455528.1 hypothetical protein [Chitinophagaceae bacterium]